MVSCEVPTEDRLEVEVKDVFEISNVLPETPPNPHVAAPLPTKPTRWLSCVWVLALMMLSALKTGTYDPLSSNPYHGLAHDAGPKPGLSVAATMKNHQPRQEIMLEFPSPVGVHLPELGTLILPALVLSPEIQTEPQPLPLEEASRKIAAAEEPPRVVFHAEPSVLVGVSDVATRRVEYHRGATN